MEQPKGASTINVPTAKEPFMDGKVAGLGFVVLAILMYMLPGILLIVFSSMWYGDSLRLAIVGSMAFVALIVGFVVGLKSKYHSFSSGLATGVVSILFAQFAIVPVANVGIGMFVQYIVTVLVPVLIGTLIGGALKRKPQQV